jgi:hypothetical protein
MKNEMHDQQLVEGIRRVLDRGTANLDRKVLARLYEARQDALSHQMEPVATLSLAGLGQGIDHLFIEPLQGHVRGILAIVALAIGALGVQFWQNSQKATELAEIDSALLSDEVSPSAYLDQGFIEWLNHLSQQDEDSLPQ